VAFAILANGNKSILFFSSGDRLDIDIIAGIFGLRTAPLVAGLAYMGFRLKPNNYKNNGQ